MKTKHFLVAVLLALLISYQTYAQNTNEFKRTVGLSASIQDNDFGFYIPIWIGDRITIGPSLLFVSAQNIASDYALGLASKFYFKKSKLVPYSGIKIGIIGNTPSEIIYITQKSTIDYYGGLAFGGEYFIDPRFSISVELQGNFTKSDNKSNRFGNPGNFNFNTASVIVASVYF